VHGLDVPLAGFVDITLNLGVKFYTSPICDL